MRRRSRYDPPFYNKLGDLRPYLKVGANDVVVEALADTGAMECVIGVTDLSELDRFQAELQASQFTVTTLHKQGQRAAGQMFINFSLRFRTLPLTVIVVKTQKPQFIVGISFCRAFGIGLTIDPVIFSEEEAGKHNRSVLSTHIRIKNAYRTANAPYRHESEIITQAKKANDHSVASVLESSSGSPSPVIAGKVQGETLDELTLALQALTETLVQLRTESSTNETEIAVDNSAEAVLNTLSPSQLVGAIEFESMNSIEIACQSLTTTVKAYLDSFSIPKVKSTRPSIKYNDCTPALQRLQSEQKETLNGETMQLS